MKIGLISLNAHTKVLNLATPLHTYVFQEFLKDHGFDSTIIDYKPNYYGKFDARHPLFYYLDRPVKDEQKQEAYLKQWRELFYEREMRYDKFENFINTRYKKTDRCYTAKILDEIDAGFDCYICVTDVIWKCTDSGFDRGFFLACKTMEGKKKIAYAASRGPRQYTEEQEKEFLSYIKDFDHIAVRETSLQQYIKEVAGREVPHVIDPVFLKDKEFYNELAVEPKRKRKKFVLLYVVVEENNTKLVKEAVEFAQERGLEVIELNARLENSLIPEGTYHDVIYDNGIEEWLWYMKEAEYIFTNSFHACCFSIIFEKQFFAGSRAGDKINSLLEMYDLEWRRTPNDKPGISLQMEDIDYTDINIKIAGHVQSSTEYIVDALKDVQDKFERERGRRIPGKEKDGILWVGGEIVSSEKGLKRVWKKWRGQEVDKRAPLTGYYIQNPGTVYMLKEDHIYSSVNFSEGTKTGRKIKKGASLTVIGIAYSDAGVPRLKVRGGFLTSNTKFVKKEAFITEIPVAVTMLKNDYIYDSPEFSAETKTENILKQGTTLAVRDIAYSNAGIPRLKVNGGYITANLRNVKIEDE